MPLEASAKGESAIAVVPASPLGPIVPGEKPAALPAESVVGPQSFVDWVSGLAPGELETHTKDIESWQEAERTWMLSLREGRASEAAAVKVRRQAPTKLHWRSAMGKAYENWLRTEGEGV